MTELLLLRVLLLLGMALAPLGTHRVFFPERSRLGMVSYSVALACAALGLFTPASFLCGVWLLFCAASFALFLRSRVTTLRSPAVIVASMPFLFSNVAAVWLVAGANDFHLLGYPMAFSYYASLHGNVLGWTMIGALAILVERGGPDRRVHFGAALVCFVSFLAVAVGIDQLHAIKPIGVVGLSLALPVSQLAFLRSVWAKSRASFALGCVSLVGLVLTMTLAWGNHLAMPVLSDVSGIRGMVAVHGLLNATVVAPCFLLAVTLAPDPRTVFLDVPRTDLGRPSRDQ